MQYTKKVSRKISNTNFSHLFNFFPTIIQYSHQSFYSQLYAFCKNTVVCVRLICIQTEIYYFTSLFTQPYTNKCISTFRFVAIMQSFLDNWFVNRQFMVSTSKYIFNTEKENNTQSFLQFTTNKWQ